MSESDEKSPTSLIDKMFEKTSGGHAVREKPAKDLDSHQALEVPQSTIAKPDGAIAQFKHNKLQRKFALQHVEAWYEGQLESARHAVAEAIRVRKAEASKVAEQLLMAIDADHLKYLASLGIRNEGVRGEALTELGDQTNRILKEVESKNWPQKLIEETIEGVIQRHRKFFQRLMQDLGSERS
jgi:translation elongation factor EF-Ts